MVLYRFMGATALATSLFIVPAAFARDAAPQSAPTPTPAAQTTPPEQADGTEAEVGKDILVTGSRIARPEYEGNLPGVQVNAQQIEARGFTNSLEVINDIPLVGPGASPLNGNNGGQAASLGAAFIDLLDLGTSRTLTLVNGRRYVSGNAASLFVDANATGSQVDVNTIPAGLISRVDVLTVGGAAAYGSDAIAGVVNFILKDDYDGIEFGALSGISERGDAATSQLRGLAGRNFADGRGNITLSVEYDHNDGLQADARDFRLRRLTTITNYANGASRNAAFSPSGTIVDVTNQNNGAFLRNSDDRVPATALGQTLFNQTISLPGTILYIVPGAAAVPTYTPLTQTVGTQVRTTNYIAFQNGIGTIGANGVPLAGPQGPVTPANQTFFNTAAGQLVFGTPGVPYTVAASNLSGNGLNGTNAPPPGLAFTTFAPTTLIGANAAAQNAYAASVLAGFGVAPAAGATQAQINTLAINVLQANRFTAREFLAANPNVSTSYFIGSFIPYVPRVANTDTTLVNVRSNATGGTVQVPVNQVLPFRAVPLEFTPGGDVRTYTAATVTPNLQGLISQAPGSNGGFTQGLETVVLRTEQDRYIGNLLAKFEIGSGVTLFTENLFAHVKNLSRENQASNNSLSTSNENGALVLNVNNPYLDAGDRTALAAVGITAANNGGSFVITRINQDLVGNNPFTNTSDTYRLVGGARGEFEAFGHKWNSEISGTYGHSVQKTRTRQVGDIEYQLALDSVLDPATNTIRCRSQLFPSQYLGRTPVGVVGNVTRLPNSNGVLQEQIVTPTITQGLIDACQPLNPFGYNQMSAASKAYVNQDVLFRNVAIQTFVQASVTGAFFDLPAGPLSVSATGEYRKEELQFSSDSLNRNGRGRAAPSANTVGQIEVYEVGGEARIPIFGDDFLPFFGKFEINPAVRVSKQDGKAGSYRNIAGQTINPTSKGDPETIFTVAGTWSPIRDITLRGNYTRSVRQPSIVELFLGGQPAFAVTTDPCGPQSISGGSSAALRLANCRADVIARGLATNTATADSFLAAYVPNNISLPGTFSGSAGVQPEKGSSYTYGGVLQPRFIPGLSLSADYISLDLKNIIQPTNPTQALAFCYDSPTYNDTSAQFGQNTCTFFSRGTDFQVLPGFASGYLNLASTQIRAINISGNYKFDLPANIGSLAIRGNAYHLIRFTESATGTFTDAVESAGTFGRPQWEVQSSARYEKSGFFTQLTYNWRDQTRLFSNGLPSTIENFGNVIFPAQDVFDFVIGADVNERFRIQLNVSNITDNNYDGENGLYQGAYIDQIGRRFQVAVNTKF